MSRYEILFVIGLTLALWLLMPITQMWDWDEPLYARTGIEMFMAGNLLLPRFNGEVFAHKPPLGYWLMGLSAQIWGNSEFAARFFSAPIMAFAALMVGRTAAVMFGRDVGHSAMVINGSAVMSIYLGAAAMMDAVLMAGYALAVWALVAMLYAGRVLGGALALFCLGLWVTLMVKGPVGPVLVGGMVLAALVLLPRGQRPSLGLLAALCGGGLVALAGFMAWFLPANAASSGALLREGVGVHIIGRALAPMEGHGGQGLGGFLAYLPYYIPVIVLGFLPWSAGLPGAAAHVLRSLPGRERALLLAWFLPTFLAFTIAATKLPHYIFPALAPLSVALAAWAHGTGAGAGVGAGAAGLVRPGAWGRGLAVLGYGALGAAMVYILIAFDDRVMAGKMLGAAALCAVMMGFVALRPLGPRGVPHWAMASLALMAGLYLLALTEVDRLTKVSRALGHGLVAHASPDAPVIMGSYGEPSLMFYARRPLDNPIARIAPQDLARALRARPAGGFAIVTQDDLAQLAKDAPDIALQTLVQQTANNTNRNGQLETVSLVQWRLSP